MKNFTFALLFILSAFIYSCTTTKSNNKLELELLKTYMVGSFNSEEQADIDTNFYNIHLEMVQIWNDREDAIWLYVEQAASWSLEKPYRQRVYRLKSIADGSFESAVFSFNDPLRFAGAYDEENPLALLSPDSLIERDGCAIILNSTGDYFEGSTVDKKCSSELRGASYATSEVRIEENVLTSWDRGFDKDGIQVWGAETGPYIFNKIR